MNTLTQLEQEIFTLSKDPRLRGHEQNVMYEAFLIVKNLRRPINHQPHDESRLDNV